MNFAREGGMPQQQQAWKINPVGHQRSQQHLKRSIRASVSEPLEDFCINQVKNSQLENNPVSQRGLPDKSDDQKMLGQLTKQQNPQARNDASASTNQQSNDPQGRADVLHLKNRVDLIELDQINEEADEQRLIQPQPEVDDPVNEDDSDSVEHLDLHLLSDSDSYEWPDADLQASPKRLADKYKEFPHLADLDNYNPPSFKVPIELLKQTPAESESEVKNSKQDQKRSKEDNCLKESSVVKSGTLHIDQKICYDVLDDNQAQQSKNPFHSAKKPKKGWIFIDEPKN